MRWLLAVEAGDLLNWRSLLGPAEPLDAAAASVYRGCILRRTRRLRESRAMWILDSRKPAICRRSRTRHPGQKISIGKGNDRRSNCRGFLGSRARRAGHLAQEIGPPRRVIPAY